MLATQSDAKRTGSVITLGSVTFTGTWPQNFIAISAFPDLRWPGGEEFLWVSLTLYSSVFVRYNRSSHVDNKRG